ncbi:MAG TPA: NUDIX domain-containing protein [Gemmataceae bacterium]|jgi:isopentenyldiphosphate isomerase|nr:NUDIX domain-containing protein [Gemmataceae bacterium]
MTRDPAFELVDVVDDDGRVIGQVTRREMRAQRLPHRATYLLVFNSGSRLFIHQRTSTKDVYPSYWDLTIGGVVAAGENFDDGARREAREELGVEVEPKLLFPFRFADENSLVHGTVYRAEHDGPFRLQLEEIVRGEFVSMEELPRRLRETPFCPDGIEVWKEYQRRR